MLRKASISALSAVSLFLFSSRMVETLLNSLSLSTLVQGAERYLKAAAAKPGNRWQLTPQYLYGSSVAGIVSSVKYPCNCTAVLERLAAPGSSSRSPRILSNSLKKLLLLLLGPATAASSRGTFPGGSKACDAPSVVVVLKSSSSSLASASFPRLAESTLVKKSEKIKYVGFSYRLSKAILLEMKNITFADILTLNFKYKLLVYIYLMCVYYLIFISSKFYES